MTDQNIVNDAVVGLSQMQIIAEATGGYYAKLRESNIPEDAAATMAAEFHSALITQFKAQISAAQKPGRR